MWTFVTIIVKVLYCFLVVSGVNRLLRFFDLGEYHCLIVIFLTLCLLAFFKIFATWLVSKGKAFFYLVIFISLHYCFFLLFFLLLF